MIHFGTAKCACVGWPEGDPALVDDDSWFPAGPMDDNMVSMVGMLVPLKGGIGGIVHPPIGSIYHLYTTYILPSGGLYATYHLSGEPETTIDGSPENHPIEKENHLNQTSSNLHDFGFHVNFQRSIEKIPGYVTTVSGWK